MLDIDTSRPAIRPTKLVSYSIPQLRALKNALGFNEDTYLNFTELTDKYGYPTETHTVTTEDGYILKIFRILPKCSGTVKPYPVLLMHGFIDAADLWIAAGTRIGLGYVLASNCFDVWAVNGRGNDYSRKHVSLDPDKDPEFWNFTFDEHGYFDLPASIDYILRSTGKSKLFFVGHSQGSTLYFVMCSLKPEYNDKVRLAVQLGPVAWMKNLNHPLVLIAKQYVAIKAFLDGAGIREIFAGDRLIHFVLDFMCRYSPEFCEFGLSFATGYMPRTISIETVPVALSHVVRGSSVKNLAHFAQLIVTGRFQRYDEGTQMNIERYGTRKPPEYNVSLVTSPVVLISAQSDSLSTVKDVDILAARLPNLVENFVVPKPYWSHHNHVWGITAPDLLHPKILDYFNKYV